MFHRFRHHRIVWLAVGLIGGLALSSVWPETPLHAVATDRFDTFAMATGPLDENVEAVFFLDFLTGDLRAVALGKQGKFNAFYEYNVLNDLGIDPSKNPRFLMVTGVANLQRMGQRMYPGNSVVYVAEITTGRVAAYGIPWNAAMYNNNLPIRNRMLPLDATLFRPAAAGVGAGVGPAAVPGVAPTN
ncbi:MAG: hypothetical protein JXB62_20745 [Pirellulales bacterium]|nr:hypothetical protein [Pirellulales bacterium]